MNIYLAGPCFTEADRAWMGQLKSDLANGGKLMVDIDVAWPREFTTKAEVGQLVDQAEMEIFQRCVSHLEKADMVIALLDGAQVDDGTAWEIGFFYRHRSDQHKLIIGIRTDLRNAGDTQLSIRNSMIKHSCDHIVRSKHDLFATLEKYLLKPNSFCLLSRSMACPSESVPRDPLAGGTTHPSSSQ